MRTPLADLHAYGRFLCKTGLALPACAGPLVTCATGHLDEGCVCFVRALAQAHGSSCGELDEAEVDALREDAWLTASKLVPLSYSFFMQSSSFAAAARARACLALVGGGGEGQGRALLDLGGTGGGSAWPAAALQAGFRSDNSQTLNPNKISPTRFQPNMCCRTFASVTNVLVICTA